MAALTPTKLLATEFAGSMKVKVFTVTPSSASDTVDLSGYFDTLYAVIPVITAGEDANLLTIHPTFTGTTVTLVTKGADGLAATDWTGASVKLTVIGSDDDI